MTPCPSCLEAEVQPKTGLYHAGCKECAARAIAGSIERGGAKLAGEMTTEYEALLRETFGDDVEGLQRVKHWAQRRAAA